MLQAGVCGKGGGEGSFATHVFPLLCSSSSLSDVEPPWLVDWLPLARLPFPLPPLYVAAGQAQTHTRTDTHGVGGKGEEWPHMGGRGLRAACGCV